MPVLLEFNNGISATRQTFAIICVQAEIVEMPSSGRLHIFCHNTLHYCSCYFAVYYCLSL